MTYGMWAYNGRFKLHMHFWPLIGIKNCLMWLALWISSRLFFLGLKLELSCKSYTRSKCIFFFLFKLSHRLSQLCELSFLPTFFHADQSIEVVLVWWKCVLSSSGHVMGVLPTPHLLLVFGLDWELSYSLHKLESGLRCKSYKRSKCIFFFLFMLSCRLSQLCELSFPQTFFHVNVKLLWWKHLWFVGPMTNNSNSTCSFGHWMGLSIGSSS